MQPTKTKKKQGEMWRFYKLIPTGEVYETAPHAIGEIEIILGCLHTVFQYCEHQLKQN